jgi:A/G-specific adenine glycosylase
MRRFKDIIWAYYRHNRREMPWRRTHDPYRILVSEIMLQQTQVARVMKFYPDFIKKFPDFRALAHARTVAVLRAWQGLGYNRRALALRRLAKIILEKYNGRLPRERAALESLPGIGKATAGAIRAFAWNEPEIFIETNIRRVFIHFFFERSRKVTDKEILRYIKRTLDRKNPREWYWALMDYGAMLGAASQNPNRKSVHYKKQPRFSGSDRELRGKIVRFLLAKKKFSIRALSKGTGEPEKRIRRIASALAKEGFMAKIITGGR